MTKRKTTGDPFPSPAMNDPWARLTIGICKQALVDLDCKDPVRRWDALLWIIDPGASDLLTLAGFEVDMLTWLRTGQALKRLRYFRKRLTTEDKLS